MRFEESTWFFWDDMKLTEPPQLNYGRDNDWIGELVYAVGQGQHLIFIQQNTQLIMTFQQLKRIVYCFHYGFFFSFIHFVKCIQFKGISKQKRKSCDYIHSHRWASNFAWNESETNKTKNQIRWTILSCIVRCGWCV